MIKIGDLVLTPYLNKWNLPSVGIVVDIKDKYYVKVWDNTIVSFDRKQLLLESDK